jgi:thiamine-monophosphate kinase
MAKQPFPSFEYKLLDSLKPLLHYKKTRRYPLPIGDDAAVRACGSREKIVLTADSFVQDVHFSLKYMSLEEVGYKAMAINVSDCAAMAALPDGALVQIVFPKRLAAAKVMSDMRRVYKGMSTACRRWEFPIIGGNLCRGPCWMIDITMLGRAEKKGRVLLRTGARHGDGVWVTGNPGEAAAGLAALRKWGRRGVPQAYRPLVARHVRPAPRVEPGRALARDRRVHALIDISDGVAKECRTLAFENKLGIDLTDRPACVSSTIKRLGRRLATDWREWFLRGGEDYELLFAAAPSFDPAPVIAEHGIPLNRIGTFSRKHIGVFVCHADGRTTRLGPGGWDHLRKNLL